MQSTLLAILFAALLALVAAKEDLMVVCYAKVPDGKKATLCGKTDRILRAKEGVTNQRRLMKCGQYCAGWGDSEFCMEYKCNEETVGETCESTDGKPGLIDQAMEHFKEVALKLGDDDCTSMMENLVCACIDEEIIN